MTNLALPKRLNPTFLNSTFFSGYHNVGDINCGRCYDWAYYAYCLYPNVELWSTADHAWVYYDGRHWDAEVIRGRMHFSLLPIHKGIKNFIDSPLQLSAPDFKRLWDRIGAGRTNHWDLMISEMKQAGLTPVRQ